MFPVRVVSKHLGAPRINELSVPLGLASHAVGFFENGEEVGFTTFSTTLQFTRRTVHRRVLLAIVFFTTHVTRRHTT